MIFALACCAPCLIRRRVKRGAIPAEAAAGPSSRTVHTEKDLDEETALGWCTMRVQAPKERAPGLPSYDISEGVMNVEERARVVYEFEQGYVVYSHPHLDFEPDSGAYTSGCDPLGVMAWICLIPYLFKLNLAIFWASLELVRQAYAYFFSAPNAAEAAEAAAVAAHKAAGAAAGAGGAAADADGEDAAALHPTKRVSVEGLEEFAHTFHITNRPLASFLADLWFYFKNNHDLLCVVCVHPLYPQKRSVKFLTLVCELFFAYFGASARHLARTNVHPSIRLPPSELVVHERLQPGAVRRLRLRPADQRGGVCVRPRADHLCPEPRGDHPRVSVRGGAQNAVPLRGRELLPQLLPVLLP